MPLRFVAAFFAVSIGTSFASAASAAAGPRSLADLKHVSWTVEQGAPSNVQAIAQTPDGFLWLGTTSGLYRFDGISFDPVAIPTSSGIRSQNILALQVSTSGGLLVGFDQGQIASYGEGRWTSLTSPLPNNPIRDFAKDRRGGTWVAHVGAGSGLARYERGRWQQFGPESGLPFDWVWHVATLADDTILVHARSGLYLRRPGRARFESLPGGPDKGSILVADRQDNVWRIGRSGALPLLHDGGFIQGAATIPLRLSAAPNSALTATDGSIWITTYATGLVRIRPGSEPTVEVATVAQGLSSDLTISAFQDREGNLWVGTVNGLDEYRPARILTDRSVPTATGGLMISPGDKGSLLVTDFQKIYQFPTKPGSPPLPTPTNGFEVECAGPDGTIMLGSSDGFWQIADGRLEALPLPPPPAPPAKQRHLFQCATDARGRTWFTAMSDGTVIFDHGQWSHYPLPDGRDDHWAKNVALTPDGEPLIYYENGELRRYGAGGSQRVWSDPSGEMGELQTIFQRRSDMLLGTVFGLVRIRAGRAQILTKPWLQLTIGIAELDGETWLLSAKGLTRVRTADLDDAFEHPERDPAHTTYDNRDGLPGSVDPFGKNNLLVGQDKRLWFITSDRLATLDPRGIMINPVKPHVVITRLLVDGRALIPDQPFTLPAGKHDIRVAFTAPSLTVPSRVRFLYRMVGVGSGWKNPGSAREVAFPGLGAGTYRFEVVAANDDGQWNSEGTSTSFTISRAFYQTGWFLAVLGVAIALLAFIGARWIERHRQARERMILDGRLNERERIARELHDTLLQGIQGLILGIHGIATRLPAGHSEQPVLAEMLDRADHFSTEGRDAVHDLRSASMVAPLSDIISHAAARELPEPLPTVNLEVIGVEMQLASPVKEEIRKIACEAFINVRKHANASRVDVRLDFEAHNIVLRIEDDGIGMDMSHDLSRDRNFGIKGMKERARKIGGEVSIMSAQNSGTTIQLRCPVPSHRVDRHASSLRRLRAFFRFH